MNRPRLSNRFFSIPASLLLVFCLALPALAEDVSLQAFTASYSLHKGSMHVGSAELSLEPFEQQWRWRLTTQARGIYAVFVHKKPYSETTFTREQEVVRLHQIIISDEQDKDEYESASFDWQSGQVEVLRKGKLKQLALVAGVYDYQSIHLLAADMQRRQSAEESVDFYRKGKLAKSKLAYLGEEMVDIGDKQIEARIFRQTIEGSRTVIRYFYDANHPLLPLLIENRKGDDSPSILRLQEVNWRL
jgi:hypothetical protein